MVFERFKKKPSASPAKPTQKREEPLGEWDLRLVIAQISNLAPALEAKEIESALIQARLADHYRDLGLLPVPPREFERMMSGLDGEGWRRMALAVGTLDHAEIRSNLYISAAVESIVDQVRVGFAQLVKNTDALTVTMIAQSEVRAEEFARHFAAHLGVGWAGESVEQSRQRLHDIDYKRLLAEAEVAKKQAEERMEYLRKKQQEDAARRRPRGKQ